MSIDVPNYRIMGKLGTGADSTIYQAKALKTGMVYAIKHVKVHSPESHKLIEQMKDEHECGSAMDHPTLRKTFELRLIKRRLTLKSALLFMEYVEGHTLSEIATSMGILQAIYVFEKAAEGLAEMHKVGFVHADLKPGNILMMADQHIKLIDFGQSCRINETKVRIQGTIDYMAPEQESKSRLDARTDVFGLGATLHKVLTGKPVATKMNQSVDVHSLGRLGVRKSENEQPSLAELPPVVAKLIIDCCNPDPDRRPSDMNDLISRCRMARLILAKRQETQEAADAAEAANAPSGSELEPDKQ
ncbi:MAG: serine/threonine protein kinase [Planctomycetes bacterium]|nr:serine/threonine protein kinase [Planctomycetota bacterium]